VKFENTFEVDAPIDEVYATLLDVERVAPCVPGAEVLEKTGDDAYQVAIKVKVGPISMTYKGNVEIIERDDANHRAVMRAKARETRGQGTADAKVELKLVQEGPTTKGTMIADVQLAGRAAAMGRGIIQDVSGKLVQTFAKNLETMLAGGGTPAEAAAAAASAPATGTPAAATGAAAPAAGAAEETGGPIAASAPATGGPAAAATASTTNGQSQQQAAPAPPRPAPAPAEESSLPIGKIVGSVILSRLKNPKVLGGVVAGAAALLAGLVRRRRG
jgi:carbon monoxide dehydrogenase subunit G